MRHIEHVAELLGTEGGQKAFLAWASSDITQALLAAARELAAPRQPINFSHGAVALALGESRGAEMVVNYLTEPWKTSSTDEAAGIVPEYGAEQILNEEYEHGNGK